MPARLRIEMQFLRPFEVARIARLHARDRASFSLNGFEMDCAFCLIPQELLLAVQARVRDSQFVEIQND